MWEYVLGVLVVLFVYIKWCFAYWQRRGVNTLPPSMPFGNIGNPGTRDRAFYESVAQVYNVFKPKGAKYGGFYSMTMPYFVPIDIELIKRVLIGDFPAFVNRGLYFDEEADPLSANLFFIGGHKWRVLRQKLTSTFTSGKMQNMFNILVECSKHLVEKLAFYEDDVRELLACYSTEVIGSCAFGLDCGSLHEPEGDFRRISRKIFEFSPTKTLRRLAQILWPNLCKKLKMRFIEKDVSDFFLRIVEETVTLRRQAGTKRNDFLELLMELEEQGLLDKKDFAAQSFVFFVAGFETSSTTLGYLLYELGKNLDIQKKVRQEIEEAMPDGVMSYEKVMELTYLDQVVKETLRLYPVLPFLVRECTENFDVNDSLTLEKEAKVIIPTLAIHMDEEFFPKPEEFDPDRFSPFRKGNIQSCTYMPFGEGPRRCIGERFGLMQVKVGAVAIISKFLVVKNAVTPNKLQWDPNGFLLKCKKGIYLDFKHL